MFPFRGRGERRRSFGDNEPVARHRREETQFRLLFVCTGNVCRSPFAEFLTRHELRGYLGGRFGGDFEVSSAGVQAVVGAAMHPDSRAELAPWGLDGTAARFAARQLSPALIERSHLVLGATSGHRSAVVALCPAALPITFSMREFARLAAIVDPEKLPAHPVARAHALVDLARLQRGLVAVRDDDVPDPMGRPQEVYHRSAVLMRDAIRTIVEVVGARR